MMKLISSPTARRWRKIQGSLAGLAIGSLTALGSGGSGALFSRAAYAQTLKPISQVHCRYLFDRADEKIQKEGKGFISPSTRKGLIAFWAFGPDNLPHCNGPLSARVIPWETGRDYDFIIALADSGTGAYKEQKIDFRADYGIKPAERPTVGTPGSQRPGELKPRAPAPK